MRPLWDIEDRNHIFIIIISYSKGVQVCLLGVTEFVQPHNQRMNAYVLVQLNKEVR